VADSPIRLSVACLQLRSRRCPVSRVGRVSRSSATSDTTTDHPTSCCFCAPPVPSTPRTLSSADPLLREQPREPVAHWRTAAGCTHRRRASGKTVLVTGGAAGLGGRSASSLAMGCNVAFCFVRCRDATSGRPFSLRPRADGVGLCRRACRDRHAVAGSYKSDRFEPFIIWSTTRALPMMALWLSPGTGRVIDTNLGRSTASARSRPSSRASATADRFRRTHQPLGRLRRGPAQPARRASRPHPRGGGRPRAFQRGTLMRLRRGFAPTAGAASAGDRRARRARARRIAEPG
jgi:hypothetical protein